MTEHPQFPRQEARLARASVRREKLLSSALDVASVEGYRHMTRTSIAANAGVSDALVSYEFGSMDELRGIVMRAAIKRGVVAIIRQGIAAGDALALGAPPELREAVIRSIA